MIATPSTIDPTVLPPLAPDLDESHDAHAPGLSPPSLRRSVAPSLPSLSPHDEALILSLLDANLSLAFLIRHHKMTMSQALAWWRQPHIKQALAELTDLSQARARAIAANDATNAVTALQSCLVLSDTEFYEQADPKTRLRAFESARKAATQVLRLAGITGTPSRSTPCAITRGSERVMLRDTPPTKSTSGHPTPSTRPRDQPTKPFSAHPNSDSPSFTPDPGATTPPARRSHWSSP